MEEGHYRAAAQEFAQQVCEGLQLPEVDRPYLEAVIVEALLFESPPSMELSIDLKDTARDGCYELHISGYKSAGLNIIKWTNTFVGDVKRRLPLLQRVKQTFILGNGTMVIVVAKGE